MTKLTSLAGIGEKRAAILEEAGIPTAEELVRTLPRKYLDFSAANDLAEVEDGELCVFRRRVEAVLTRTGRKGTQYVSARLIGDDGRLSAVWFNNRYVASNLEEGSEYLFYGRVQAGESVTLMNPQYKRILPGTDFSRLQPVYTIPQALTQNQYAGYVAEALKAVSLKSLLPARICEKYSLKDLNAAYRMLHRPRDFADVAAGSARVAVEELVLLMAALRKVREENAKRRERRYADTDISGFLAALPFELTPSQIGVAEKILAAMRADTAMNLLLQGDVGSGKTVIAFLCMYVAANNGCQAAMMAPTEVLARQHYKKAADLFKKLGFAVELLTGGMPKFERRAALERIRGGQSRIVIGTHAVIQGDVEFRELALVVTDEQHRFGVRQRARLAAKGGGTDVLVMSATPIPRTLSLVMYGDLDIATIAEKPAGRKPVKTSLVPERKYVDMLAYLKCELENGRQAYFVCPAIEDSGEEKASVERLYAELSARLPGCKTGMLHGGMPPAKKQEVMEAFAGNRISLLVATTVVEVGVDVANATVIVISDADRFGLSQLHQLRGRVGRGDRQSYCFLLTRTRNAQAVERLKAFAATEDGFEIANRDFELRGGGELLGSRQSGFVSSPLRRVKFDGRTVERAREIFSEAERDPEFWRLFEENAPPRYREPDALTI